MAKQKSTTESEKAAEIRSFYTPSEQEKRVLKMVYDRKHAMENGTDYKDASRNWPKWRKQWESLREPKNQDDWQSNHVVPLTTAVVEAALADIVDQSPNPIIMARGSEDVPRATVMRHIFSYTWEVADGDVNFYDIVKDALICGTAIGQECFVKLTRKVKRLEIDKDGKEKEVEDEIVEFEDCMLEPVRLEDFLVDENARGFTGAYAARDCIRRYIMSEDDFRNFFRGDIWNPLDNAKYVKAGGDTNYYEHYQPPQGIDHGKQVEVLWYWSRIPEDWLIIVANDVVVKMGPNPYKHKQLPFVRALDVKRPHKFYGKGESELLESVQDEKNTIRRMIIDRNHLDIDKMFLVSNRSQLAEEDLVARPHGMIPVDDASSVKAVEYGDIPRSVDLTLKALDEDGIIVTGIDPRFTSAPQTSTATQAAILKESTLKRIRMKIRMLEREFLVQVARLRVANIIQFYSQPKMEMIVGEKDSIKFKQEVEKMRAQGLLVEKGDDMFVKKYREIRLTDKMLDFDEKGQVEEKPFKGQSFFEAKPEFFVPVARGGFDIKFAAGATLPISKPLQQTKDQELYDRLIQNPAFDPMKLGDMIAESNDHDPSDLHLQQEEDTQYGDAMVEQQMKLAMQENKAMATGEEIPATEMASPAHTRLHIEFMKSEAVPTDQKIIQIFTDHIVGELMAQQQRQGGGTDMGMIAETGVENQSNSPQTTVQSGETMRRMVTPGKNAKAPRRMSMQDVMPAKITGSRTLKTQV